jgi:hypothetical protein
MLLLSILLLSVYGFSQSLRQGFLYLKYVVVIVGRHGVIDQVM